MYSFAIKTSKGYILTIRTSFDYSQGETVSTSVYPNMKELRKAAKALNAKAWNY